MPTRTISPMEIREHLWKSATRILTNAGIEADRDTSQLLQDFIQVGVRQLESESLLEAGMAVSVAQLGIMAFANELVAYSRTRKTTTLVRGTYEAVHHAICPLWPFC